MRDAFVHAWEGSSRPGLTCLARFARLNVGLPLASPADLPTKLTQLDYSLTTLPTGY